MIDPDLFAEYEAWKGAKLLGQTDFSVAAFNAEMEGLALAYEQGVKDAFQAATIRQSAEEVVANNPYRKPGMRGEKGAAYIPARRSTFIASTPTTIIPEEED